jgi:hypothetical protein
VGAARHTTRATMRDMTGLKKAFYILLAKVIDKATKMAQMMHITSI